MVVAEWQVKKPITDGKTSFPLLGLACDACCALHDLGRCTDVPGLSVTWSEHHWDAFHWVGRNVSDAFPHVCDHVHSISYAHMSGCSKKKRMRSTSNVKAQTYPSTTGVMEAKVLLRMDNTANTQCTKMQKAVHKKQ